MRARAVALSFVERREHFGRWRFPLVNLRDFVRTLGRIAIHEAAFATPHESEWRMFGERDAIHQPRRRRIRPQTALVVRPQKLDLAPHAVRVRHERRVRVTANDAMRQLVGRFRHASRWCTEDAG